LGDRISGSIAGEMMKRSAFALVLVTGLVVLLRKPAAGVLNQLRATVVRTEHRTDDRGVAHEGLVSPPL
jgi:hypothetical protein